MGTVNRKMALAWVAFGTLALAATPMVASAQAPKVDPAATRILKRMTDYVGSLKQFSVHTQIDLEDLLVTGQRIDEDIAASVTVSRPNKLRAERRGGLMDQAFYYDGKTFTLYNGSANVYATEPAPKSVPELLDYVSEKLGLIIPASDLVYPDAYALLMRDVTFAAVIGKAVIGRMKCDHLVFGGPGVDFQVWVADSGPPLPCKYVVTDRGNPGWMSISTVMSDWNVAPDVADARFTFVPPKGAKQITFLPLEASGSTTPR